jgi:Golgi nucleoside diphosphatase
MRAGSRVHVYKFLQSGGKLDLQSDTFEQLKPGLSSYADAPEDAAKSLTPLLDTALKTVPDALQARCAPVPFLAPQSSAIAVQRPAMQSRSGKEAGKEQCGMHA